MNYESNAGSIFDTQYPIGRKGKNINNNIININNHIKGSMRRKILKSFMLIAIRF